MSTMTSKRHRTRGKSGLNHSISTRTSTPGAGTMMASQGTGGASASALGAFKTASMGFKHGPVGAYIYT